jgi:hypothetical protein
VGEVVLAWTPKILTEEEFQRAGAQMFPQQLFKSNMGSSDLNRSFMSREKLVMSCCCFHTSGRTVSHHIQLMLDQMTHWLVSLRCFSVTVSMLS